MPPGYQATEVNLFLGQNLDLQNIAQVEEGHLGFRRSGECRLFKKYLATDLCLKTHFKFVGGVLGAGKGGGANQ